MKIGWMRNRRFKSDSGMVRFSSKLKMSSAPKRKAFTVGAGNNLVIDPGLVVIELGEYRKLEADLCRWLLLPMAR